MTYVKLKINKRSNKVKVNSKNTALMVTDPQNDFLSPEGVTWGMVRKNVTKNNMVENNELPRGKPRGI